MKFTQSLNYDTNGQLISITVKNLDKNIYSSDIYEELNKYWQFESIILILDNCQNVGEIDLSFYYRVHVVKCGGLFCLKSIKSYDLKILECSYCIGLVEINCPSLCKLIAMECYILSVPQLPNLKALNCSHCPKIKILENLENLELLNCSNCPNLCIIKACPSLRTIISLNSPLNLMDSDYIYRLKKCDLVDISWYHLFHTLNSKKQLNKDVLSYVQPFLKAC